MYDDNWSFPYLLSTIAPKTVCPYYLAACGKDSVPSSGDAFGTGKVVQQLSFTTQPNNTIVQQRALHPSVQLYSL